MLRVELTSERGETRLAEYETFEVASEDQDYKLHIGGYIENTSTAGEINMACVRACVRACVYMCVHICKITNLFTLFQLYTTHKHYTINTKLINHGRY